MPYAEECDRDRSAEWQQGTRRILADDAADIVAFEEVQCRKTPRLQLNAPNGVQGFVDRLGPMMRRMGAEARTDYAWTAE
jgi:hypothetical protein